MTTADVRVAQKLPFLTPTAPGTILLVISAANRSGGPSRRPGSAGLVLFVLAVVLAVLGIGLATRLIVI